MSKVIQALTPIEDQWTLTSLEGEVYEEVEIEELTADEVVFKHRVGKNRLPLALLTEQSQQRIHDGFHVAAPAGAKAKPAEAGLVTKPA